MTKHALNAFLAMSVAFGNEISDVCDLAGANGEQVSNALRREPRIGARATIRPGLGSRRHAGPRHQGVAVRSH
ncbi:MAG: hypothetical protein ACYDC4_01690 [Candidatus Dormibacteria bacterium]